MSFPTRLQLERPVAECGGAVHGEVSWWGNGARQPIEVVLRYRTTGRGDQDDAVVSRWAVGDGDGGRAPFRLDVPPSGPVTYNGQLLRLRWEVQVTVPGGVFRRGRHPLVSVDLVVTPRGWLPR